MFLGNEKGGVLVHTILLTNNPMGASLRISSLVAPYSPIWTLQQHELNLDRHLHVSKSQSFGKRAK